MNSPYQPDAKSRWFDEATTISWFVAIVSWWEEESEAVGRDRNGRNIEK